MAFLDIKNVSKSYEKLTVLHDINIAVEEGEFLVLVGPSGCGKSTLLNMIAGLEEITSGSMTIKGQEMNGVHPSKRNIAMVFQSYALYPNMTVADNIAFGLEMHGVPKAERLKAVQDVSGMLQIEPLLDRKPSQLSGGQRQRVAMGRALVRNPDVFLFDEPLSNLDAKLRVDMRTEIKKLHQDLGSTIVYVTHDQIEAMTLSTRIAVMNGGHIQQLGTPKEIYDNPANIFVASFMGSPSMNIFPAIIREIESNLVGVEISIGAGAETKVLKFAPGTRINLQNFKDRKVLLGIRPEAITDPDGADKAAQIIELIDNTVEVTEPAGSDTYVISRLGGQEAVARMRADVIVTPGEKAVFALNMDRVVIFDPQTEERIN
ncbi:ABC transporter ATP-binding protein [Kiloniella sp. EL199]|uniref:ABC transporter ATP-binding protein n=1 Tax=Kiloniella sp. EL199 TaxID=2107581 RepID=UPI000EA27DE7|nr:sn-glycerol-3-phosphate ABC transporter ATP-binding protein UgpC [Kiloniella sp. EL199]